MCSAVRCVLKANGIFAFSWVKLREIPFIFWKKKTSVLSVSSLSTDFSKLWLKQIFKWEKVLKSNDYSEWKYQLKGLELEQTI